MDFYNSVFCEDFCEIEFIFGLFAVQNSYEIIGFSLLFAISLMALLEHWFMVLPIPDARLWRWMLPKTKSKQDYLSEDYNGL